MGFSIGTNVGLFGSLFILLLIAAGAIMLYFLLSVANLARREVIDEEIDEGHDPPVA